MVAIKTFICSQLEKCLADGLEGIVKVTHWLIDGSWLHLREGRDIVREIRDD